MIRRALETAASSILQDERDINPVVVLLSADRDDCPIAQGRECVESVEVSARVRAADAPVRPVSLLDPGGRVPVDDTECHEVAGRDRLPTEENGVRICLARPGQPGPCPAAGVAQVQYAPALQ